MTRRILFAAAVVPLLAAGIAWGASENIKLSKHNFAANGGTWAKGEICKPCHTPHNAAPNEVSGRLWNHELTTASYTLNGHDTEKGAGTAEEDMDRVSRLCLSCHDGTVALDSFGGANGTTVLSADSRVNLGTDLSNDHPVGKEAVYTDELAYYKPADYTKNSVGTGTAALRLVDLGTSRTVSVGGVATTKKNLVVSCNTCHDAHGRGIDGAGSPMLLRASNAGSSMCLTCHNK